MTNKSEKNVQITFNYIAIILLLIYYLFIIIIFWQIAISTNFNSLRNFFCGLIINCIRNNEVSF